MRLRFSKRFIAAYHSLQSPVQAKVDKALAFLRADPGHPSLRLKRMQGEEGIWEVRVDRQHRLTLEMHGDRYVLRNVGKHDETLGNP